VRPPALASVVSIGVLLIALLWWSGRAGEPQQSVVAADVGAVSVTPTAEPAPLDTPAPTALPTATPTPPPLGATSCDTGEEDAPEGTVSVVPGDGSTAGSGPLRTFTIEVEDGLAIDGQCFAGEVQRILFDDRSWAGTGEVTWQRVDVDPDTRIVLASPATADELCVPFQTNGIYSCTIEQERTVLNVNRWREGAEDFLAIDEYRIYLINHEIGHALRHDHVGCPAAGLPAPVMMQQTKSVDSCVANPWPLRDETEG
jgi:hypothetical protein